MINATQLIKLLLRRIIVSGFSSMMIVLLIAGCQNIESKNDSSIENSSQSQSFTLLGVSPELHAEAIREGEEAKSKLKQLEQDRSLSTTAKRILLEAEEAEEQGNQELYLAKIQEYSQLLNDQPLKRAAEAKELEGKVLFSQLQIKEALEAIKQAVTLDPSNSSYLLTLADYLRWNGQYQRMEKISLQALALIKNQPPVDETSLSQAHSYLGLAYLHGGKYNQGEIHLQLALEMSKKLLGEEHPDVAIDLNNLAGLYRAQGKYDQAEPLYLQALGMNKKLLGEEHPRVAAGLNNLAGLYRAQGKYDQAEPLYLQALEMDKKLLGEEHPDVATRLNNLAALYRAQGKYDQAEPLYLQALEMSKKLLGEEHPNTKVISNNLNELRRKKAR